jgi:hypothetical protein
LFGVDSSIEYVFVVVKAIRSMLGFHPKVFDSFQVVIDSLPMSLTSCEKLFFLKNGILSKAADIKILEFVLLAIENKSSIRALPMPLD